MEAETHTRPVTSNPQWPLFLGCLVIASLLLMLPISGESLDMDEGFSAWLASHTTFGSLWQSLLAGDSSDLHMGLFYSYLWLWTRLFGSGEVALRAVNFPFGILFCAALGWSVFERLRQPVAPLVLALCPMLWFHLNGARPYAILSACAAVSTAALLAGITAGASGRQYAAHWCLGWLCAAVAIHPVALLLLPAFAVIFGSALWSGDTSAGEWRKAALLFSPIALSVAVYHTWAAYHGTVYSYGQPNFSVIPATLYHFAGFSGLGPGREQHRVASEVGSLVLHSPWLAVGMAGWIAVCAIVLSNKRGGFGRTVLLLAALGISFGVTFLLSALSGHHVPTRHFLALLPLAMLLVFEFIGTTAARRRSAVALTALAIVWGISDLRLRFLPDYGKPDYRGAVHAVLQQVQKGDAEIAWTGDLLTASYYGLRLSDQSSREHYAVRYEDAVSRVPWRVRAHGTAVTDWPKERILPYLAAKQQNRVPVVLAWRWPDRGETGDLWKTTLSELDITPASQVHGFDIYLLGSKFRKSR